MVRGEGEEDGTKGWQQGRQREEERFVYGRANEQMLVTE